MLQNIDLGENLQDETFAGQEPPHHGHTQEVVAVRDVKAATEAGASPTLQSAFQTTESQHPPHSPDISRAIKNALNDLAIVIMAWPRLPDSIRTGIVAMVKAASSAND